MALHRYRFHAMAAENEVHVHAANAERAAEYASRAIAEVARVEAKYSRYRPDSVVSRINAAAGGAAVEVDAETLELLHYAATCHQHSGGLFDATSGVLRRAWRFDSGRVPSRAELEPLLPLVDWKAVEIEGTRVRLARAGMELDFGGFGKEYAVDRAACVLAEAGARSAMVNLAGDLAIVGAQPGGRPWSVGVVHPRKARMTVASIPVASGAIATSGDYERFLEVDGVRHCHILDPRTGRSVRGFQSVTVHAATCLVAGSATTIAMLKGRDEGLAWLDALGVPYLAVLENGAIVNRFEGVSEKTGA
ncbi:MAG TPA: FAD:protein FMN transferase [Usitatibacter sp.]|jgi:thiamine biosynthesis lipoprotein|nr:FAD:protein FMN transferase [Usitatibacter sp.]